MGFKICQKDIIVIFFVSGAVQSITWSFKALCSVLFSVRNKFIYVFYRLSTPWCCGILKFFLIDAKEPTILHGQQHYWCSSELRDRNFRIGAIGLIIRVKCGLGYRMVDITSIVIKLTWTELTDLPGLLMLTSLLPRHACWWIVVYLEEFGVDPFQLYIDSRCLTIDVSLRRMFCVSWEYDIETFHMCTLIWYQHNSFLVVTYNVIIRFSTQVYLWQGYARLFHLTRHIATTNNVTAKNAIFCDWRWLVVFSRMQIFNLARLDTYQI